MTQKIAPSPDFRYVGLSRHERRRMRTWAGVASFGALLGAGAIGGLSAREIVIGCIAGGASFLAARALTNAESARPISMAIVPWGVLIEEDASPRVLFWPAIKRVHMETAHSRDAGATTTLFTTVTIETESHAWSGRTSGTAPLERLLAYLADYAEEQSRPVAYDLDGDVHGDGPSEPDCEPLLESARAFLSSTEGANRLGLPPLGYRNAKLLAPTDIAVNALRGILRSRESHEADPRAFAAAIAAEISAKELVPELMALLQCPHPVVAAVAKQAAKKLGVSKQQIGLLDEVKPFLRAADVELLAAWAP